jgi:branched-chain amino acid transport system ATP-binding protein
MRALVGQLAFTAGTIHKDDIDISRFPSNRRARAGIGYVPQGRQIFPDLTVHENLLMGALGARRDPREVAKILTSFPLLQRLLDRKGSFLSGGEQQLLAVARALAGQPDLLLLDEPTDRIQPSIRDELVDTLSSLRPRGISLLVVEQNIDFAKLLTDQVLVIQKGKIRPSSDAGWQAIEEEFAGLA